MDYPVSPTKDVKKKTPNTVKTIKKILKPGERKKKQKLVVLAAIKRLILYIEANCLDLEGIFRISGNAVKVKELKKSLENEEDIDLSKIQDKNVIAGAFKMFLREMAEPLLTFDLYKNFLGSYDIKDKSAKVSFLKSLITALPKENAEVLQTILKLFYTLQLNSTINKMTSVNLAIVFAPTLLRPKEESFETMMNATNYTTDITKCLIEEFNVLYEINTTILYKISSVELTGKEEKKTIQEQLDEANAKIEVLTRQASDEAKERSVLETYAHQTYVKLQEEMENYKAVVEEKDSMAELIGELKDNNKILEDTISKQKEEIANLTGTKAKSEVEIGVAIKAKQEAETQLKTVKVDMEKQIKQNDADKKRVRELEDSLNMVKKESEKNAAQAATALATALAAAKDNNKKGSTTVVDDGKNQKEIERLQKECQDKTKELKSKSDQLDKTIKERDDAINQSKKQASIPTPTPSNKELETVQKKLKECEQKEPSKTPFSFVAGKKPSQKEPPTPPPPQLVDEDDVVAVKQFAFYWMILSLKTDAMLHGKSVNICSTDVLEELLSKRIRVNKWNDFVIKKLKDVE
eukprot:gene11644-13596_t